MQTKTKELGQKENHEIPNFVMEDPQRNIIIVQRQELKIWENYIKELIWLESLEFGIKGGVGADQKASYLWHSDVEKMFEGNEG